MNTPLFKVFMPESVIPKLQETLFSGYIAEGEKVFELSKQMREFVGNENLVLMNSCTSALAIALRLSGTKHGSEVISTPLTCVAANQAISSLGANVVWADVEKETGMVDPSTLEDLITEKTTAIMILHKEGDPAKLDEILTIAHRHGIKVVEDAAHAIGAEYKGKKIGSYGDFACFSFQAIKHITTGDGGALACGDPEDAARARKMKWLGVDKEKTYAGSPWLEDIDDWGYKANMHDISATIGLEMMPHLQSIIDAHNRNGRLLDELLQGVSGINLVPRSEEHFSTYWAYCLLVEEREKLMKKLADHGFGSGQIHPRNDRYSLFAYANRELPGVDYFDPRELAIPCGWWMEKEDVGRLADVIKSGW